MKKAIKEITIGKKSLKNNLFLAPMLGYTNFVFREEIQKIAEISTFTEMISINSLSKDSNYCKNLIRRGKKEKNVFFQFFGNDEKKTIKSIENILAEGIKIDFFNLNCGCPAKNIINQGAGAALLKQEAKINAIIKTVKDTFDIPVTIKIRADYNNTKHLDYQKLEASGCDAIFIHEKTKKQQLGGLRDAKFIANAKKRANIPIIANGGIKNISDCESLYNHTYCDGFMIGRGALSNPFVFREILKGGHSSFSERVCFLENCYNKMVMEGLGKEFLFAKNLSMFLTKGTKNASEIRTKISKTKDFDELIEILKKTEEVYM